MLGGTVMGQQPGNLIIFDFTNPADYEQWQVINDGVMGGISQSTMSRGGKETALFLGTVSLENYGGFCSASTRPVKSHDLSSYKGIAMRLKGDGKKYKATLKTDASFTGFVYQYAFSTRPGEWITVQAPFQEFVATFRGMPQQSAGKLDSSSIKSFGFLISDKQAGRFRLEIDWIKSY